jgi:hypothetical protein
MFSNKKYNNLVLFIFILGAICIFSNKPILDTFKNMYKKLLNCYEKFTCIDNKSGDKNNNGLIDTKIKQDQTKISKYDDQKDFHYHSENLQSAEADELYKFLQTMVSPNVTQYDLTSSFSKKHKSDKAGERTLLKFLELKLNNSESSRRISNIKILDKVYYFKNQMALEIVPLQISGEYFLKNKSLGNVKLQIEITFRFDQPSGVFMSQTVFNKFMGVFKFNRITLINHHFGKEPKEKKEVLPVHLEKPLTYSKYSFNYDNQNQTNQPKDNGLDTINSLIPEEIKITTEYEKSSENRVTSQIVRY